MSWRTKTSSASWVWLTGGCAAAVLASCASDGGGEDGTGKSPDPPPSVAAPLDCSGINAGPTPLRRMTRDQYENTVRMLFDGVAEPSARYPQSMIVETFTNDVSRNQFDPTGAEAVIEAAEEVATAASSDTQGWLGCDTQAGDRACLDAFLGDGATRIYRRPLADAERDTLLGLFDGVTADGATFAEAVTAVVQAMLASPQFLYLHETGDPDSEQDGMVRLTAYEVASRLSFLLWNSMPDDALFAAAEAGQLGTPEQVRAQAERMLEDPRVRPIVSRFHREWLQLGRLDAAAKSPEAYPNFSPTLIDSMKEEVDRFVSDVYWDQDGDLNALLTGTFRYVDASLAPLYSVAAPSSGWSRVEVSANRRSGLLTTVGFLTAHSHPARTSPTRRGRFIREKLLCLAVPNPPPSVNTTLPPRDPNASTRDQLAAHRTDPNCAGCHNATDPIGLSLEHYGALGEWRDFDGNIAVDASGEITGAGDADAAFYGGIQLSEHLVTSERVHECVAEQWLQFARSRPLTPEDACDLQQLTGAFSDSSLNLKTLLLALTESEGFLFRPAPRLEDQ